MAEKAKYSSPATYVLETYDGAATKANTRLAPCTSFYKKFLVSSLIGLSVSSCAVTASSPPANQQATDQVAQAACPLLNKSIAALSTDAASDATQEKPVFVMPEQGLKDYTNHPNYEKFLTDTAAMGVPKEYIRSSLQAAERKKAILEAISRPAEKRLSWGEYRQIFITPDRIKKGKQFLETHRATFEKAEQEYGVPKSIIAAIIGVETWYGGNKGDWRVLDALATLAFDYPPREPFFREQLQYFLKLSIEQKWQPTTIKGSYAGAMGFPQFMPSSYRDYAVDFNQDNKIDLINDPVDAIGSVGNYLKRFGWITGQPVLLAATGPDAFESFEPMLNQSLTPHQTLTELTECGIKTEATLPAETMVTAHHFKRDDGYEYWLGMHNFYVLSRYNRSALYVMAVNQLSEALAQ